MSDRTRPPASWFRFPLRRSVGLAALAGAVLLAPPLAADTSETSERTVAQLAPGVFEIRHADPLPGWVNGNTLVVIGTRSVFVVDSCSTEWEAQADIAQIRQWTDRPVRYVLNTHWHHDHNAGNGSYLAAFPGAEIVATSETTRRLDATAPHVPAQILDSVAKLRAPLERALSSGEGADGQPLSAADRARDEAVLAQAARVEADARDWVCAPPTLTFDDALTLDLGGRVVSVQFLGRGNTGGDAIAWLPAEKILATGDLVVHPVPFPFDGYPTEWIRTLERLAALDAAIIVPGHGEVEHDSRYILQLRDLFRSIVEQVGAALDRDPDAALDDVRKSVDVHLLRAAILGDDTVDAGFFDYAIGSFVEFAYHEAKQR